MCEKDLDNCISQRRVSSFATLVATLASVLLVGSAQANPTGTTRIEVGHPQFGVRLSAASTVGDRVFMILDDYRSGRELWITDGTQFGTRMVREVNPGDGDGARELAAVSNGVVFSGVDPDTGDRELWFSDGTEAGTQLLVDIAPGPAEADVGLLRRASCAVFFTAADGQHGKELWVTDGTAEGTRMVADIAPGETGADIGFMRAAGDVVYFRADDGIHGSELWVSDGTEAGTSMVADLNPGPDGSLLVPFAGDNGEVLFASGNTIWFSDGTEQATQLLVSGEQGFHVAARFGSEWVFPGFDEEHGLELWASDGTPAGTRRLLDTNPGPGPGVGVRWHGSSIANDPASTLGVFGDRLYFQMFREGNGAGVGSLASTDGETAVVHAEERLGASRFLATRDHLFFAAQSSAGAELFSTDGTIGNAEIVENITAGGSTTEFEGGPIPFGDKLLFAAKNNVGMPERLFVVQLASGCNCATYEACIDGRCAAPAACGDEGGSDGDPSAPDAGSGRADGGSSTAPDAGAGNVGAPDGEDALADEGCQCTSIGTTPDASDMVPGAAGLMLLAVARVRRRRRKPVTPQANDAASLRDLLEALHEKAAPGSGIET